ncbi:hypothetical protein DSECCO2_643560 [anaerobic digester metagenome]
MRQAYDMAARIGQDGREPPGQGLARARRGVQPESARPGQAGQQVRHHVRGVAMKRQDALAAGQPFVGGLVQDLVGLHGDHGVEDVPGGMGEVARAGRGLDEHGQPRAVQEGEKGQRNGGCGHGWSLCLRPVANGSRAHGVWGGNDGLSRPRPQRNLSCRWMVAWPSAKEMSRSMVSRSIT